MDTILEQTGYREYIEDSAKDSDEYVDRWANVMELRNTAAEDGRFPHRIPGTCRPWSPKPTTWKRALPPPRCSPCTPPKGWSFRSSSSLGWRMAFCPTAARWTTRDDLDEERRLFYVGITRAMDRLYLSHAFRRTVWGQPDVAVPSRFLREIPDDLLAGASAKARRQQTKTRASSWNWSAQATPTTRSTRNSRQQQERPLPRSRSLPTPNTYDEPTPPAPSGPRFHTGQRVRHAKFGEGTVIDSKVVGNDEEVHVAFAGEGVKRLAASFAKLEILD